jgi:hypothetical protein
MKGSGEGSFEELGRAAARIADALERLAPPAAAEPMPGSASVLGWDGRVLRAPAPAVPVASAMFIGVDQQRAALRANLSALKAGRPAHDMLLWGARGMGKSGLVRSLAHEANLALIEAPASLLDTLPALFDRLAGVPGPCLLFVDDLAFLPGDPAVRTLRSLLDGGVRARPAQVRLAVTSNHRHLLSRPADEVGARHARDRADDALALVDRFGLVLGFHEASQDDYLAMCAAFLAQAGRPLDATEALAFALARGGRSGRTAWHYRVEVLGRE